MHTAEEITKKVNEYIDALTYDRQPFSLYEPIQYVLAAGGKRVRPTLMLLAYELWRDDSEVILPTATALETYHNYTLLHDDLMDNADVRRGRPTVHKKWNANAAILSGDSMLVLAFQRMTQCPDSQLRSMLDLFATTALEIGEGQQYDMEFEDRMDVTEEEYIEMIRLKTSVLLACALKMGALQAGASEADANNLYKFGEKIGLSFQLQDDYLDVYGNPEVFGKAIGGDILCNKKTYMLINAVNRANPEQRAELEHWLQATDCDPKAKIEAVTSLYNKIGVDQLAKEKIEQYFNESRRYLDAVDVPAERKQALLAYTAQMMKRSY